MDMNSCDSEDEKLRVRITGPSGEEVDFQVEVEYSTDDKETVYATVKFLPTILGKHDLNIFWRDSQIRNSPCTIIVKERPCEQ